MRALSEAEFAREAKPAFDQVFGSGNPFECVFTPTIEARMIVFPVHYMMESAVARAITNASDYLNEPGFYLSVIERPKADEQDRPYHWEILFSQLQEYRTLGYPFVLENAIYSKYGTWGLMFSHEQHALLGGPADFVQEITKAVPGSGKHVEKFVEAWRKNHDRFGSNLDWLPSLLRHVCGDEQARKLLVNSGLKISLDESP